MSGPDACPSGGFVECGGEVRGFDKGVDQHVAADEEDAVGAVAHLGADQDIVSEITIAGDYLVSPLSLAGLRQTVVCEVALNHFGKVYSWCLDRKVPERLAAIIYGFQRASEEALRR